MTPIDRARQALEIVRSRKDGKSDPARALPEDRLHAAVTAGATPSQTTRQVVQTRIRALPRDDSDRDRKAIRIFVDMTLTAEFGAQVVNSTEYREILDSVVAQIGDDALLSGSFLDALRQFESEG